MIAHHPIKIWRFNAGMTQGAFARRVGVIASHICEIERWKKTPSVPVARRIAALTGLSMDQVLTERPDVEAREAAD